MNKVSVKNSYIHLLCILYGSYHAKIQEVTNCNNKKYGPQSVLNIYYLVLFRKSLPIWVTVYFPAIRKLKQWFKVYLFPHANKQTHKPKQQKAKKKRMYSTDRGTIFCSVTQAYKDDSCGLSLMVAICCHCCCYKLSHLRCRHAMKWQCGMLRI